MISSAQNQPVKMTEKVEKSSIIELCPIRNVVSTFGRRWALSLIVILNEHGPLRFNQLAARIPDISAKVLASTLHSLEADGLLERRAFAEVPPMVEYELTDPGRTHVPLILALTEWAQANMQTILKNRSRYERRKKTTDCNSAYNK